MQNHPFRSANTPRMRPWRREGAIRKVALCLLATALIAGAVTPAFAGEPQHGHQGGRQQHQRHELSTARKHHGKGKTLTKAFTNSGIIAIPAVGSERDFGPADPYPSTIEVSGFKNARISDLNLTLRGFSHTFTRDVDVLLVAPDGRNLIVMGDVGGRDEFTEVTDLTITLDDEAAAPLPVGNEEGLTSGTFQPLDQFGLRDRDDPSLPDFPAPAPPPSGDLALSVFDGTNPNGQWQLFILDDTRGDIGALSDGWTLEITAQAKTKKHRR